MQNLHQVRRGGLSLLLPGLVRFHLDYQSTTTTATSHWHQLDTLDAWQKDSVLHDSELSVADGVGIDGLLQPEALELDDEPSLVTSWWIRPC